jgi:uncharacterized membrane-anchored protein
MSRAQALLACLLLTVCVIVAVDGWAIAFLPRVIEYVLVAIAIICALWLAVSWLLGRRGQPRETTPSG